MWPCRAVVACPGTFGETLVQRADALLEWLCLHLEEEELPQGFDPRGRMLDVIRPGQDFGAAPNGSGAGGNGEGSGAGLGKGGDGDKPVDSVETRLLQYGFGHAEVANAIAAAAGSAAGQGRNGGGGGGGGPKDALDARTLGPLGVLSDRLAATSGSARKHGRGGRGGTGVEEVQTEEEGREATDEEVMSLEAIYDGAVTVSPHMPEVSSAVPWVRRAGVAFLSMLSTVVASLLFLFLFIFEFQ